ncbi:MAG: hypothetical protein WAM71_19510 [Candidatus Korobacteraceae bacterium]
MTMLKRASLGAVLLASLISLAGAQVKNRDPLTEKEVDQMRETADFPNKRLELMIGFARGRMKSIDDLRAATKIPPDRAAKIHDLLQDFLSLLDEMDDNIGVYDEHKTDMRKGLTLLIEADSEWQLQLRQLKDQSPPEELQQYSFALANAKEAVSDSAQSSRDTLEEQDKLAAEKKLNKEWTERKD